MITVYENREVLVQLYGATVEAGQRRCIGHRPGMDGLPLEDKLQMFGLYALEMFRLYARGMSPIVGESQPRSRYNKQGGRPFKTDIMLIFFPSGNISLWNSLPQVEVEQSY